MAAARAPAPLGRPHRGTRRARDPTIVVGSVALRATGLQPEAKVDDRLIGALRYDGEGDPLVRTPKAGVGSVVRREWRVCGKSCDAISGRGKEFRPGEVLAGSRVQVRVVGSSGEATIETPGWDGQLRALRRPTITGSARIGSVVEANPGKWTGGWLGAETFTGLRACPTRQGGGKCVALTASALGLSDTRKRTLPASFRGWWIGAIEWHVRPGGTSPRAPIRNPASPTSPSGHRPPERPSRSGRSRGRCGSDGLAAELAGEEVLAPLRIVDEPDQLAGVGGPHRPVAEIDGEVRQAIGVMRSTAPVADPAPRSRRCDPA